MFLVVLASLSARQLALCVQCLMQNEGKTDNRKTMITFLSDDFSTQRVKYANIDCEINQSEHSLSLSTV